MKWVLKKILEGIVGAVALPVFAVLFCVAWVLSLPFDLRDKSKNNRSIKAAGELEPALIPATGNHLLDYEFSLVWSPSTKPKWRPWYKASDIGNQYDPDTDAYRPVNFMSLKSLMQTANLGRALEAVKIRNATGPGPRAPRHAVAVIDANYDKKAEGILWRASQGCPDTRSTYRRRMRSRPASFVEWKKTERDWHSAIGELMAAIDGAIRDYESGSGSDSG